MSVDLDKPVRWVVDARFKCKPGYKSGGGVTGVVDTAAKAEAERARLAAFDDTEYVTVTPLYAQARTSQSTEGLRAALADYDAAAALCPVRGNDPRSVDKCRRCGATTSERCGQDNPFPVVQAARDLTETKKGGGHG